MLTTHIASCDIRKTIKMFSDVRLTNPEMLSSQGYGPSLTDYDIIAHFNPKRAGKVGGNTLNSSEASPGKLAYMLLYVAGHPLWEDKGVIFSKSDLHLLPEYKEHMAEYVAEKKAKKASEKKAKKATEQATEKAEETTDEMTEKTPPTLWGILQSDLPAAVPASTQAKSRPMQKDENKSETNTKPIDYAPESQEPVAVFMTRGHNHYGFHFVGWHIISNIAIVLPHTEDLQRLMALKAGNSYMSHSFRAKQQRELNMEREWAVIKLQRLEQGNELCPPVPVIEKAVVKRKVSARAGNNEQAATQNQSPETGSASLSTETALPDNDSSAIERSDENLKQHHGEGSPQLK